MLDYQGNVWQTAITLADGTVLFPVTSLAINQADALLAIGA